MARLGEKGDQEQYADIRPRRLDPVEHGQWRKAKRDKHCEHDDHNRRFDLIRQDFGREVGA